MRGLIDERTKCVNSKFNKWYFWWEKNISLILIILSFLPSTAYAQQCEAMLTHAVRLTEETESTSQSLDDKYYNHCSKEYLEKARSEGRTTTAGGSYAGYGAEFGQSETSNSLDIELNQECRLDDIDKRSSGKYRAFLQKLQPEYFQAYSQCLNAQGDLIFSVTSGATSKQVNVVFKSRRNTPINIVSAEVVGDKSIRCIDAASKDKLSALTFPITLEKNQFAMNCVHEPNGKDGDVYTYGAGTLFVNADSVQNSQTKVLFPGSKSVVGKSLSQLEGQISSLHTRLTQSNLQYGASLTRLNNDLVSMRAQNIDIWESAWLPLSINKTYEYPHGLGMMPDSATLWYATSANPTVVHRMHNILSDKGYGTYVTDVTEKSYKLTTGVTVSSSYGYCNSHYLHFNERSGACTGLKPANSQQRYVKVVFTGNNGGE